MKENGWKMEEALKFVKTKRSCVNPNMGFKKHLKRYEVKLGLLNEEQLEKEIEDMKRPYTGIMLKIVSKQLDS
jgi:hypothetical protein